MEASEKPRLYNVATTTPDAQGAREILVGTLQHVQKSFKTAHPTGASQITFMKEPKIIENENRKKTIPHYHGFELEAGVRADGLSPFDSRGHQIGFWTAILIVIFLYMFLDQFINLNYDTDATLFTNWKRGQLSSGNNHMGMMDMGAFNLGH